MEPLNFSTLGKRANNGERGRKLVSEFHPRNSKLCDVTQVLLTTWKWKKNPISFFPDSALSLALHEIDIICMQRWNDSMHPIVTFPNWNGKKKNSRSPSKSQNLQRQRQESVQRIPMRQTKEETSFVDITGLPSMRQNGLYHNATVVLRTEIFSQN